MLLWVAFYLTVHFNVNDEQYSFWLPMKFIVAAPQVGFSIAAVYGFGWLFARPLDVPVSRVLLYLLASFVLLHIVYYYALAAAQPFAPDLSVTHRRWAGFMAGQGPFYFLRNFHYLLTVSSYLLFSQLCVPLGVKMLVDARRENQRLAAARQQQAAWELAGVRTRLNPVFLQQMLAHLPTLLAVGEQATAAEATLQLARVLRYTLYEARTPYVPLRPELDALLDYVQLQELRLHEQVEVSLHLTVAHAEHQQVLSGLLLPLTEQWLMLATTLLEIDLRVHEATLTLVLQAVGTPSPAQAVPTAVLTRLAHYAPAHQLTTHHTAVAHTLTLQLPLRSAVAPGPSH
ncbi:MAG: histidine kinase [Janthinobacterium lividum]